MMNLDEILRSIGQQMAQATPRFQAPGLGGNDSPFGNIVHGSFGVPELGSIPSFGSPFDTGIGSFAAPERQIGSFGSPATLSAPLRTGTTSAVSPTGQAAGGDPEVEQYIRQAAATRHIDPEVAVRVWGGEGKPGYIGDQNSSFGPYQLHYGNVAPGGNAVGGLGDAFTKDTGLDARDPATWKAQVDWSLNYASKNGWGPWHGHQGDPWEGIGNYNAPVQSVGSWGANDIMQKVQPFLGKGYVWGGKTPQSGFDCSGLAGWLTTGEPESTVSLYQKSQPVGEQQAQPGDLVFYNMDQSDMHIQHVAVYLGNGKIVQSGGTENKVNVGNAHQPVGSAPEFRRVAA